MRPSTPTPTIKSKTQSCLSSQVFPDASLSISTARRSPGCVAYTGTAASCPLAHSAPSNHSSMPRPSGPHPPPPWVMMWRQSPVLCLALPSPQPSPAAAPQSPGILACCELSHLCHALSPHSSPRNHPLPSGLSLPSRPALIRSRAFTCVIVSSIPVLPRKILSPRSCLLHSPLRPITCLPVRPHSPDRSPRSAGSTHGLVESMEGFEFRT